MSLTDLLSRLRTLDINLWAEGDRLRYSAPPGALSPELKAELVARRQEILDFFRQVEAATTAATLPITPASRDKPLPLSFAQQRLWFLDQLDPGNLAYNMPEAIHLQGPLHLVALERSLAEILRRHEALRTVFPSVGGQPVQQINEATDTYPLTVIPCTPAEVNHLATEEARRPFDLAQGPLFRASLLRLGEQDHFLLLTMHHIVSDGWSLRLLFEELTALYNAFATGRPSPLPPLPVQYADFAQWQRQWLQGEVLETQLAYWRQQLGGELPTLHLPADHPRPAVQSFNGLTYYFDLSPSLAQALRQLSQQEGVTLFMTLLAAFKVLLYRYTGQSDLPVGTPIANRHRREIEGLIGFFVNTLVLRTGLSGNLTFRELLRRVREVALGAYNHQDLPFEQLVDALQPDRDLSQQPLFQVMFALQDSPVEGLALTGLRAGSLAVERQTAQFDLSLDIIEIERGIGLKGALEYNTDLFEPETMIRLAGHFQQLLEGLVANPEARIAHLPLLPPAEQHQILVEWNGASLDGLDRRCIHHLFEAQVDQTPERIALVAPGFASASNIPEKPLLEYLTYQELNRRANRLAHYLQTKGVGPEVPVALCLERSPEMMVGVLAVLKAGGAYIPLDPLLPADRLAFMLEDTGASVLLTQAHLRKTLPPSKIQVICLDTDWPDIILYSACNPESPATADNLAYLIFTSGSTGRSKGVMVNHHSLVNAYRAWEEDYRLRTTVTAHLQMANFAFDVFSGDWVRALCSGGKLVLAPRDYLLAPAQLYALMRQEKVDIAEFVPAVFRHLVQYLEERHQSLDFMRVLILGSDSWYVGEYKKALQFCGPETRLINSYGLTEATIDSSYFTGESLDLRRLPARGEAERMVPIGRPFPNTQLYILDAHLQPVPVGVAGELCVGGLGLARGYLNRPELTAEKFIPNPFNPEPGSRLYRTGDLARYHPDGQIELIGRVDHQVKLRGFRIELGEIEALLGEHPAVQQAIALVKETGQNDDKRLVAYIVPKSTSQSPMLETLTQQLVAERISLWQDVYNNEALDQAPATQSATFNITGWNSSYTGQPIPATEMEEWVDQTVARILALKPERVLEIGCGTGLLLFRIAPHCRQYHGTDFSQTALNYVRRQLDQLEPPLPGVTLSQRLADDLEGLPRHTFDTLVINSVIQYFPTIDYLVQVLTQGLDLLKPGGHIFVGDVRHLGLLETFHSSVQRYQAPSNLPLDQLQQRIQRSLSQEEELVVDPAFFYALQQQFPCITQVEIRPKRGRSHNELTRFRYDAILHVETSPTSLSPGIRLDWQKAGLTLSDLQRLLQQNESELIQVVNIPNARLSLENRAMALLNQPEGLSTVGELQQALSQTAGTGLEPEDIWALSARLPYQAELSWARSGPDGYYDAIFFRKQPGGGDPGPLPPALEKANRSASWQLYANNPLQPMLSQKLVPPLRSFLKEKLPDYMVPNFFIMMAAFPLTTNGKVDRQALPVPDLSRPDLGEAYLPPRNPVEEAIAGIWSKLLGLERVGIQDNFFELGGHSLLATQLVSRLRQVFQVEFPLRHIFESPTIASLAEIVARSEAKPGQAEAIIRRDPATPPPLSFAQQRLWFLDQLEAGNPAYNFPVAIRLSGRLNVAALEQSLVEIIRRHEALRTTFTTLDDEPIQVIHPQPVGQFSLSTIDLQDIKGEEQVTATQQLVREEAGRPFDLTAGPLWRATLLRLAEQDHLLLLTFHHIVFDGWSENIFFEELAQFYQGFIAGSPPSLPPLPVQYADFAHWQREWLGGEVLAAQLAYWQRQLEGHLPILHLPVDHPRPPIQTFRGATQTILLPAHLGQAMKALSQQTGTTLFITLLTAFKILLYRYTGQTDLLVGTPIANRNRSEIEGLIGFFVNTLVLRTDLSDNPTCRELLERVRETALGAYAHQDLPFEQLVEVLHPERNLSHQPLFQVMFGLQTASPTPPILPELTLTPLEVENDTAQFELSLFIEEVETSLKAAWEYNTDLFDPETIARMIGHWQTLLADMAAHPEKPISDLQLLTAAEIQQIRHTWNDTRADYPQNICLHQLIEAQVEKSPEAIAIVFTPGPGMREDQTLTYQELNRQANRLAHHLQALGVGPETRVGIAVERSPEMMVGLLAILKAGGAYVPLDPAYPQERLAFMVADAGISILLTQSHLLEKLPDSPQLHPLCLDQSDPGWTTASAETPVSAVTPEHLAYVIYTSGSTGRPKGVQIPHRAVINFLSSMRREPGLSREDILLAVTTLSFDIAALELFLPLAVGATVAIASRAVAMDGPALARCLVDLEATVMQATPATWQMLLASGWQNKTNIRIWCGGEAMTRLLARQLLEVSDEVWNLYGPTETTIWSTTYRVEQGEGPVSVGRPIANTQLYILDAQLQPLPVGLPGELYLGGAGLARGYLNRPELTAERFIPDPFSQQPGLRLYRTGDLARYRPDGTVEILGRIDHQVKVRGFRIELEEIETSLNSHPEVDQAVVVAQEFGDNREDRRLVAYLTSQSVPSPDSGELRAYLAQKLPEYMLPSLFIPLEAFPLTPNGKVDRRALPAPTGQIQSTAKSGYVAPRDPLELQLTRIWETILETRPLGIKDNFFELGGHSLLAVRLMAQIKKRFDRDIPLAALFQNPTIEHLAGILRQDSASRYQSPLVEIQRRGTRPPFFCVHPADGTVLSYVHLARHLGPQQPFYGLQRIDSPDLASNRVEGLAATYIQVIQTVQPHGPYLLGGWSMGGIVAFEMARQLHREGQTVPVLALFDSWAPSYNQPAPGEPELTETELDAQLLAEFLADLRGRFAPDLSPLPGNFSQLSQEERLTYVIDQAKMLETVLPEGGLPQLYRLLRIFRANTRAVQSYLPQPYQGKITLFQAQEEIVHHPPADPALGWAELSLFPAEIYRVPGNHYTLLAEPHVQTLAEQLGRCLEQMVPKD